MDKLISTQKRNDCEIDYEREIKPSNKAGILKKFRLYCVKIPVMETLTITILEPKAKQLLDDLASMNLIKVQKTEKPERKPRKFGSMKGLVKHIADDFDAPLKDFEDYM